MVTEQQQQAETEPSNSTGKPNSCIMHLYNLTLYTVPLTSVQVSQMHHAHTYIHTL